MLQEAQTRSDAELVAQCREGDREAFALVVERYQNLLCGLAYSLCGDVGRSEDLAQETFIVAWRKLAELESPDRLKAWLCGILRNLSHNAARALGRDPLASAAPLEHELASAQDEAAPAREAMSHEEQALLWTVLQGLPDLYREPLVLFYRSGDSAAEVAEALELSEEAVRQRLSRGRALLGQRITRLIESGLRTSGPTKAFTLTVMAALTAASSASASAATTTATLVAGNATASAKQVGFIAKFSAAGANLVGVVAGLIGLAGHILNTRSRSERRFIAASAAGLVICGVVLAVAITLVYSQFRPGMEWSNVLLLSLVWLGFCGPLDAYACWMALRQKQIRARDKAHPDFPVETARRGYRISMYGATTSIAFGAVSWLMLIAAAARDASALLLLAVAAGASAVVSAGFAVRRPAACAQSLIFLLWFLTAVNFAAVGLRWHEWAAAQPLFAKNPEPVLLLIAVIAGSVRGGWFLKQRLLKSATVKRDSLIAAVALLALMMVAFAGYRSVSSWEASPIQEVQVVLNDVRSDGSIGFRGLHWGVNDSGKELRELRFVSSVPFTQLLDSRGRQLDLQVRREDTTLHFVVPLIDSVPPGGSVVTTAVGEIPGKLKLLPDGTSELSQRHWPANGLRSLYVERNRLPADSQLVSSNFPNVRSVRLGDGRLEVWVEKLIPAWGNIQFALQLRIPKN
jgi:RNA polymerase sigma factor (sigma-70 family)